MSYRVRAIMLDLALSALALILLYEIRLSYDASFAAPQYPGLELLLILGVWFSSLLIEGAYDKRILGTGIQEFKVVISASFKGFLAVCLIVLAAKLNPPRINLFAGWIFAILLITVGRKVLQNYVFARRRLGDLSQNTIIVGSGNFNEEWASYLSQNRNLGYKPVDQIVLPESNVFTDENDLNNWLNIIDQSVTGHEGEVVIIEDFDYLGTKFSARVSSRISSPRVEFLISPSFIRRFGSPVRFTFHNQLPLVFLDEPELSSGQLIVKRSIDIALGSIAAITLFPFMLLIGLGIYVSSPGPILFTQERVGLGGKRFRFVKFRTMVVGAEALRQEVLGTPDPGMVDRYKNDPRIFPFGRFLRRFSLDELPQIFSVIRGKMSLVGPRPILVEELELLDSESSRRHLIKPGLTGIWQVSGRKDVEWDQRIRLDLRYVDDWSIGLDLGIILKTIKVVLTGKGSY